MKKLVLVLLALCLFPLYAQAWTGDSIAELPDEVVALLPQDEDMLYELHPYGTLYMLLKKEMHRVRIFRETNGHWTQDAVSSWLPYWHGIKPSIDMGSDSILYLRYSEDHYATFVRDIDGQWELKMWYINEPLKSDLFISFFSESMCILKDQKGTDRSIVQWIYGKNRMDRFLETLDVSQLPKDVDEACALVDTTGWAVVNNNLSEHPLLAEPTTGAEQICVLYPAAPVQHFATHNGWVQIGIGDLTGWLPETSLLYGTDMLDAQRVFPNLIVYAEGMTDQTKVFAAPSVDAEALYKLNIADKSIIDTLVIIGKINEDWYLVFSPEGVSGFMEARWWYGGNG